MLVLSRDGAWLSRLELLAGRGGWPFEARAALPAAGRTPPPERALAVLDRGLAGAAPSKAVAVLRELYPIAAIVLACDAAEMDAGAVASAVSCGADEVLVKSWSDDKLSLRLSALRDRSLFAQERVSADGALRAVRRSHRAAIKVKGRWRELALDGGGFAVLWRLLEREGESVTRAALGAALASATGREIEPAAVARRVAALKKALAAWKGRVESARGGLYRIASGKRRGA